ncbi:aldose epimerase family protein [Limosilactobacillus sp.]|jgi:aldose 1-epimerase|uniref:aldose epimerase family protein n=1 Tax=Limosilactobacillus sp. TaxID=2773925 RepID=UPI0025B945E4|nr:aldose epimerase family protein [Limosilactobacillus sp.]MCH3921390.1 galactose mutarotase [Limosilactobacillus sp.]MCH3928161.1 galactose mutarotase [Limosilactobacillus sp.]
MKISNEKFGSYQDTDVIKYTLTNDNNVSISILNFAGIWQAFMVPNTHGGRVNLLLAADSFEPYVEYASLYAGRIVGRAAGRIAKGKFDIDGESYSVPTNEGNNLLHGGANGLPQQFYQVETKQNGDSLQAILTTSIDTATDNLPGKEDVKVTYTLFNDNSVTIDFDGQTDAKTLFNPTSHTYWNLSGEAKTIQGHVLSLNSTYHLQLDDEKIPTGKKLLNKDTPYDFKYPTVLGTALQHLQEEHNPEGGFDDVFVVLPSNRLAHEPVATLMDAATGRKIKMYSDRNGLVVYTANGVQVDGYNRPSASWFAIALEGQTLPDSPHHSQFGDIALRPGHPEHYELRYEYFA